MVGAVKELADVQGGGARVVCDLLLYSGQYQINICEVVGVLLVYRKQIHDVQIVTEVIPCLPF